MANNGNKGRFSDRIKKIRFDKLKKKKGIILEDGEIMYKNFLKVVAIIPLVVVDNIFSGPTVDNKKKIVVAGKTYVVDKNDKIDTRTNNDENLYLQKKLIDKKKIESINVSSIKKKQDVYIKSVKINVNDNIKETNDNFFSHLIKPGETTKKEKTEDIKDKQVVVENTKSREVIENNNRIINDNKNNVIDNNDVNSNTKDTNDLVSKIRGFNGDEREDTFVKGNESVQINGTNKAKELEKQIINLIKKDLVKIVNELEIYESELYILNEIKNDEKTLNECRKNINEVKKILAKIEQLKAKYDYLKDNYDFEYLLEVNNQPLIDKIIELRNMFDTNEVIATVSDYKLLEVYKSLYLKVDEVHEKTQKIELEKLKQEEKIKQRDIDFNKLKNGVYDVNKVNESYMNFIRQQNLLLSNLSDKISKIDSREVVEYKFKGYGKYLSASFKYLGLLMLTPLRGIFPSIATQTIITRNAVSNLRNDVGFERHSHMVYNAIDYSGTIDYAINDLDYTGRMVDATLDDLIKLKIEYNKKFKEYQGDFSEYQDVIQKINKMQESMINGKIKIEIMRNKMKSYDKQNKDKLELVRKLNNNEEKKNN